MNIEKVLKEIRNPALQEIVKDLGGIVADIKSGKIMYQQGNVEIVGCKHIIQSIALDWMFNKKSGEIKRIKKS